MKRTLAGRTILVTRPADQAAPLVRELERRGARVLAAPTIRLVPSRSAALTAALKGLAAGRFAWIMLTSATTVAVLRERLAAGDLRTRVAAIGEGTAEAYRRWTGRDPDLVPKTFTTAALASAFPRGTGRILTARADIAPAGLEDALAGKGWEPTRVDAYRTVFASSLPRAARDALRRGEVDAVTFTSASTVEGFVRARGPAAIARQTRPPNVIAIGPVTAAAARRAGLRPAAVASPHTQAGLVEALERALRDPRRAASPT